MVQLPLIYFFGGEAAKPSPTKRDGVSTFDHPFPSGVEFLFELVD